MSQAGGIEPLVERWTETSLTRMQASSEYVTPAHARVEAKA
jgi:hypothetical protein